MEMLSLKIYLTFFLGQSQVGVNHCTVCDFIYTIGVKDEEQLHSEKHNFVTGVIKFAGKKKTFTRLPKKLLKCCVFCKVGKLNASWESLKMEKLLLFFRTMTKGIGQKSRMLWR